MIDRMFPNVESVRVYFLRRADESLTKSKRWEEAPNNGGYYEGFKYSKASIEANVYFYQGVANAYRDAAAALAQIDPEALPTARVENEESLATAENKS